MVSCCMVLPCIPLHISSAKLHLSPLGAYKLMVSLGWSMGIEPLVADVECSKLSLMSHSTCSVNAIIEIFARVASGVSWAGEVTLPSGVGCLLVMVASGSI